jgi:hypothetical protein
MMEKNLKLIQPVSGGFDYLRNFIKEQPPFTTGNVMGAGASNDSKVSLRPTASAGRPRPSTAPGSADVMISYSHADKVFMAKLRGE